MKTTILFLSLIIMTEAALAEPRWWTEGGRSEPGSHEIEE